LGYTVGWDEDTEQVAVTDENGNTLVLDTKNSDGTEVVFDRTMVVPELIEKLTGARVYATEADEFIVYTGIPEWTPDRDAEKDALDAMRYVMLPFFRMFI
jgi:hypothetical protein